LACQIRLMNKMDIQQVTVVDREAFPTMWPPVNFHNEMSNRLAHYVVACDTEKQVSEPPPPPAIKLVPVHTFLGLKWPFGSHKAAEVIQEAVGFITGFSGMWILVDEAHIINLAVRGICRGKGIGELLLISSIDMANRLKASVVTLEVRATNTTAQNLYYKYGFNKVGIRRRYYTDNNEDALILTTDIISSEMFQRRFQKLKEAHLQKMRDVEIRL
jgi:ribosomal-protein-alanine N-acetyltransferase